MGATILGIDDDPVFLQLHKAILEMHGYRVLLAKSGLEAFDILKEHPVDCVVLDFHMPGMNGAAVAAKIKCQRPNLPIILVSGSTFDEEVTGVDAYVTKTSACSELPNQIAALLTNTPPMTE